MTPLWAPIGGGVAVLVSTRAEGDARERAVRARLVDRPWSLAAQVHGRRVVDAAATARGRPRADALVAPSGAAVLGVLGADCALIGLAGERGEMAAVHAGWRGLVAGVIDAAARELHARGARSVRAVLGPHICARCYEFSPADLTRVEERLGAAVASRTRKGAPSLDLGRAVATLLERAGVELVADLGGCGACSEAFFSHRGRADRARHVLAVCSGPGE